MTSEIRANTLKNRVGLGTVSFTNTGPVVSGIVTANGLELNSVDAGSTAGPELKLFRNSASPADADYLGQLKFAGESDTGVERNYAKITGKILDASNGTEDGIIEFAHIKAGSQNISARFRSDSLQLLNGTALTVAGTSSFNGDITGAAGVDLNLDSTLGNNSSTAYSGFDGRLVFDTSYSDSPRGPNKIQLQNASNTWIGGFGVSNNALDIYTGGTTAFRRSTGTNTYTTQLTIDFQGNISPTGDVRLAASAGNNSSTAVTDAAWGRLEFDQDYSDTARGPNKILLTPYSNWKAGFGISSNSFDVYTGGIIHFYGKTNTDDAANKETLAKFTTDGAAELYHNNVKQFETTSAGAKVNGEFLIEGDTKRLFLRDTRGTGNTARPGIWMQDSASSNQFFIGNGSSTDTHLEFRNLTTGDLIFKTNNNTERLRITSSGRVGINETSPDTYFHVKTGADTALAKLENSASSGRVQVQYLNPHGDWVQGIIGGTTDGDFLTYTSQQKNIRFYTNNIERLRITSDGSIGMNATTPSAGDLATGDSQNTPLVHIKGSGVSASGGEYNLLARFEAGGDADETGAMIVLNHSNDRGLAIQGGRRTGNYAHGALKMIDNVGRLSNAIFMHGGAGQGVNHMGFYTGESTTTTERLRITATGQTKLNITSNGALTEPLVIRNGGSGAGTNVGMVFYNGNEVNSGAGALAKIKAIDEGSYDGALVFETASKNGWSNTGTSERLRISSEGYVTAPNNVAFSARGGPADVSNAVIVFGTQVFQRGGTNYSTSTGIFTAPVAGIYHFMCNPYRYTDSNDSQIMLEKSTNGGSSWTYELEIRNMNNYQMDTGRGWFTLALSNLIDLNANDQVRIRAINRVHCNNVYSRFSGFLVA